MHHQECLVEGWLKVCECAVDQCRESGFPKVGHVSWHAGFVVIRHDERSLICYKDEKSASRIGRHLQRIRLDGGYKAFYRKWGYPTPPPPPSRPFVMVVEQHSDEEKEDAVLSDDYVETVSSVEETDFKSRNFVKSHTSYDLIDSPGIESQSLDRRRGWSTRRVMPSSATTSFVPDNNLAIVESPSTSHRLANFLSRPFRVNPLKRTKSVSKLDRKRSALDNDGANNNCWSNSNPLSATPSIAAKLSVDNRRQRSGYTPLSSNIRNSRSHDSLLSYSTTTHAIDLAASGCSVTPLHTSVLGTAHCFRINTDAGATKYYACRSSAERDRWMDSLRRTMQPNRDDIRREENSLQLWIFAVKGIPCKRKYYCEVCLDHVLYSRTTSKFKAKDECFWGEQFEINHLPKLESVCINLYREAERKKKKDRNTLVGYVQIPVSVLASRCPVEKWYPIHGAEKLLSKGEIASLRVKARYQTVTILPLRAYDCLLQYLRHDYLTVCSSVENLTSVKSKEDMATSLVRILHKENFAKDFLCDLVMAEVQALDNYHLMFRGNSLATKAMEAYMKLVGDHYLHETLSDFIQSELECDDDCEVDPSKLSNLNLLVKHQELLMSKVHLAWGKIVNSFYDFPNELREVFYELRKRLNTCGRQELGDYLISSNIFLRFLCPAVLSPSLFNLVQEYPNEKTVRNLTLIAKTVQTLANFTKFGVKEHYMEFMNKFVEGEWDHMRQFLLRISSPLSQGFVTDQDSNVCEGCVDMAKELSLLHIYLVESWSVVEQRNPTLNLHHLKGILDYISECLQNPTSDATYCQQQLLIQNNDVCTPPSGESCSGGSCTSPTSDYENYNNDCHHTASELSTSDDAASPNNTRRSVGNGQASSASSTPSTLVVAPSAQHRSPATNLNTDDDYVWYSAINENLGLRRTGMVVQQNRLKHAASGPTTNSNNNQLGESRPTLNNDLRYFDQFRTTTNDSPTTESHPALRISQNSLVNGPGSSGYQSLNYSTSNSSSPVENGVVADVSTTKYSTRQQRSSVAKPKQQTTPTVFPLAIANPLYSLQTVPLMMKEKSASTFSLPDFQTAAFVRSGDGVEVEFENRNIPVYGGTLSPDQYCYGTSQFMTPQSRRWRPKNALPFSPSQQTTGYHHPIISKTSSSGGEESGSSGEQSPVVSSGYNKSGVVPRTNPRYGNSEKIHSSRRPLSSLQRSTLATPQADGRPFVLNTFDEMGDLELRKQAAEKRLEDAQRNFKEAENLFLSRSSEILSSPSYSDDVNPIINRLRLMQQELEDEQSESLRKQKVIEVQQKRIELLQSANEKLLLSLSQLKEKSVALDDGNKAGDVSVADAEHYRRPSALEGYKSCTNGLETETACPKSPVVVAPSTSDIINVISHRLALSEPASPMLNNDHASDTYFASAGRMYSSGCFSESNKKLYASNNSSVNAALSLLGASSGIVEVKTTEC